MRGRITYPAIKKCFCFILFCQIEDIAAFKVYVSPNKSFSYLLWFASDENPEFINAFFNLFLI